MPGQSSSSVRVFYPRFSREEAIGQLTQQARALSEKLPLVTVVLFGSYATGRHTAASDIDVLVIYRGPRREDAFALVKKTLKLRGVEPHVYTEEEADRIRPTLERMTREGVALYPR